MNESKPSSEHCANLCGAVLSSMVVRVICSHCNRSIPALGQLNQAVILANHRDHLDKVTVELWLKDLGSNRISEMQLRLLSLEAQFCIGVFPAN